MTKTQLVREMRGQGRTWKDIGKAIGKDEKTARRWAEEDIGRLSGTTKFFYISDVHFPQQHNGLLLHAIDLIAQLQVDVVTVGGDWFDAESVSSHPKNPHRTLDLANDLAQSAAVKELLHNACKNVVFLEGNHEDRLRRYLTQHAPAVQGLINPRDVFWPSASEYIPYPGVYQPFPHLSFVHGRFARSAALASVRAHYNELGTSVVMGHTHRHATAMLTVNGRDRFLVENGHMQDEAQVKFHHGPWQQSAGVYVESDALGERMFFLDFPKIGDYVRGIKV